MNLAASGDPKGRAVLFLHGFMGSSDDWRGVTAAVGDRAFTVAVDLPGHGASLGLPEDAYTFEGAARAVVGTMDEVGAEQATIVGYSMGGRLALYLALRYPERCRGLFLESASPGLRSEKEWAARRAADEEKALRLESEDFGAFLQDWYRQPVFQTLARNEELLRKTLEARRRNDPKELARSLRGMGTGVQASLWEELAGLEAPTFAVAGELDRKFVEIAGRMSRVTPKVRPVTVPDAGHNVHLEVPRAYISLLRGFLDSP